MARARNIKPGFFSNEELAQCEPLARLLFAGLWCWADRDGRLEERVMRLKAQILPYDDCDVGRMLAELAKRDFIVRYRVGNSNYIQIQKFRQHQNPHVREMASTIPAPGQHQSSPADSLILDSLNPITESCHEWHDTENESKTAEPTEDSDGHDANGHANGEELPESRPTVRSYPDSFEEFWNAYPNRGGRKRGKHKTFSLWKLVPAANRQSVVQAATAYAASRESQEGYARDPERFFKDNWWRDWLEEPEVPKTEFSCEPSETVPVFESQAELTRRYAHRK